MDLRIFAEDSTIERTAKEEEGLYKPPSSRPSLRSLSSPVSITTSKPSPQKPTSQSQLLSLPNSQHAVLEHLHRAGPRHDGHCPPCRRRCRSHRLRIVQQQPEGHLLQRRPHRRYPLQRPNPRNRRYLQRRNLLLLQRRETGRFAQHQPPQLRQAPLRGSSKHLIWWYRWGCQYCYLPGSPILNSSAWTGRTGENGEDDGSGGPSGEFIFASAWCLLRPECTLAASSQSFKIQSLAGYSSSLLLGVACLLSSRLTAMNAWGP